MKSKFLFIALIVFSMASTSCQDNELEDINISQKSETETAIESW